MVLINKLIARLCELCGSAVNNRSWITKTWSYEEKNAKMREAHRDAWADFNAVFSLPILAKLSEAAPASLSTVSAFAGLPPRAQPWLRC